MGLAELLKISFTNRVKKRNVRGIAERDRKMNLLPSMKKIRTSDLSYKKIGNYNEQYFV
ncbi:hypothetical protein GM661_04670 [Iocasia frigidifontis]|uniref:Uncharacterized protein n=2 Tax=Iocasia fonsfrigidae TaxID=2682810 RepID=A0A8A7KEK0_9FIRM|nr:hypothetical protein GM661_04670 [Iocasia fonsfrigidae]